MELWQEAFKVIEDIHGLLILAKKMPRPQQDIPQNITAEEQHKLGSQVLIATLAVPLLPAHPEFDPFIETENNSK